MWNERVGAERGALVVVLLVAALAASRPAAAQSTWSGATSDYNTSTNWTPNTAPVSAGQSAVFSNTGSTTVNVSSAVSPDSWTFNANSQSYVVTGAGVTFGAAGPTGGIINNANAGQTISIGNVIGGIGAVQQLGNSTLQLSGANTYTGGTVITAGTLQLTGAGAPGKNGLGDVNGTTTISGGVLDFGARGFIITDTNQQGTLSQSGGTVQNGALEVNTYKLTGGTLASNAIIFGNALVATSTFDLESGTVNGNLAGGNNVQLVKTTAGTVTLAGFNDYSGGTFIKAGTLQLSGHGALGDSSGATTISGGTLDLGTTTQVQASLSQSGGTVQNGTLNVGTYQLTGGVLAANAVVSASTTFDIQAGTVNGLLSGAGQFRKSTAGTVTLAAANNYTGGTIVTGGLINFNAANNFGSGAITLNGGGLQWASGTSTDISSRLAAFGSGGATFDTNGNSVTLGSALSGPGGVSKIGGGTLTLSAVDSYGGATTISGGTLVLAGSGSIAGSSQVNLTDAATTFDISNTAAGATVTTLAGVANSHVTLGTQTLTLSNGSTNYAGIIQGTGGLTVSGGTQTLSGINTYTGATTINGGALVVDGSIVGSNLTTVNSGGTLAGTGVVGPLTVNGGGIFAPGPLGAPGTISVNGNLAFQSGATYLVNVTPAAASLAVVSGTTSLGGAVDAQFLPGAYLTNHYAILVAVGGRSGTFSNLVTTNLPARFSADLSYTANDVVLNLTATLGSAGGFGTSQNTVAGTINSAFNNGSALPPNFVTLFGLSGANLNTALTQVSGETATGSQQTTFSAMTQFMGTLLDHVIGKDDPVTTAGELPYAERTDELTGSDSGDTLRSSYERDAYGAVTKVVPRNPVFDPHWSAWTAGFGGAQTTDGNATPGSNSSTSRVFGMAAGADYLLSPHTIAGFAVAGGGTSFSVANGGTGRSDLFQAGAFVKHTAGAAYFSGAVAYGWQDITTDRTVTVAGIDRLHAQFNANTFSGRSEVGYRFVAPWIGLGITPYAAEQFTDFELPAYAEQALTAVNTFALAYNKKNVTDTRSELGIRTDKSFATQNGILTLRGRLAWAHDFDPDRSIGATFQALPGASFVVNGAAQASDSALTTASAEMKWINGWSAATAFEGEFSDVTRSYAGKGVVRYTW